MEFFKSAVASAISKGPPFLYNFGDRVDLDTGIWTLYNGTKREDGSKCSIFSFDITVNKSRLSLARNAVKKLRTLRHPKVIKVLDTVENDSYIYIATERVVPLSWHINRKSLNTEIIKWGLFSVAQTIKFINGDAASIHGAVGVRSVFTSESGEWRLAGFEILSCVKDDDAIIYSHGNLLPNVERYSPPELAKFGWDNIRNNPPTSVDAYNFGILISEVFNGSFSGKIESAQITKIPPNMQSGYKRLINSNPKSRSSVEDFFNSGIRPGGYFNSPLISLTEAVDQLGMKSEKEKEEFINDLDQLSDDYPEDYFKMKVLPELLKCMEFGGGGPNLLSLIISRSKKISADEFEHKITPTIVRLFSSPDRAIRVCLLDNLSLMIDRIPNKIVNDKIFPQMTTGFTDIAPVVREQTIKAVLTIINKLTEKTINGELLKYLAKTSNDEQPGIRTNTTICLGKISKNLSLRTRAKVLIAAFTRSLRDPFVHARNAALMALAATSDTFSEDDSANRILPALCPCLIDKEKIIRDQANKTIDIFLKRLRKFAATMPESVLPPQTLDSSNAAPRMGTPQPSEAASWTGWAISSFTNKVSGVAGDIITGSTTTSPVTCSSSIPSTFTRTSVASSSSPIHHEVVDKLSTRTKLASNSVNSTGESLEKNPDDIDGENDDPWDNDDNFFDCTSAIKSNSNSFPSPTENQDDEPDFAGWLAAQVGKKPSAKPLPKGLARSTTSSKFASKSNLGGLVTQKNTIKKPVPKVVTKKINTTPNENEEDDGWGDGW